MHKRNNGLIDLKIIPKSIHCEQGTQPFTKEQEMTGNAWTEKKNSNTYYGYSALKQYTQLRVQNTVLVRKKEELVKF